MGGIQCHTTMVTIDSGRAAAVIHAWWILPIVIRLLCSCGHLWEVRERRHWDFEPGHMYDVLILSLHKVLAIFALHSRCNWEASVRQVIVSFHNAGRSAAVVLAWLSLPIVICLSQRIYVCRTPVSIGTIQGRLAWPLFGRARHWCS